MSLWHDIGFSLRSLRRQPGLVLTSLAILTLGIGANTTLFTAVKTILLDPLPYPDPSRLVMLYEWGVVHDSANPVSPPDFYDWQRESKNFTSMAAFGSASGTLSGGRARLPEHIDGAFCTWNLFQTLGVQPALGRSFTASDDTSKAPRTILLSDSLWRRRFDADPHVLGKTLRLNSELYTIIGVMPARFNFWYRTGQYWVPLQTELAPRELTQRGDHRLRVVARLKPGIAMRQANTELSAIQARYKHEHPDEFVGRRAQIHTLWSEVVDKSVRKSLYILWAAVGCVLLIACVNIANLLLTRSTGRRREMAIRTALGATRRRIVRLFLLESLILSCAGGLAGILLASRLTGLLVKVGGVLPRASALQVDWTAIAFGIAMAILSGIAVGLLPAFAASRVDLNQTMHESGRGSTGSAQRQRFRNTLVVAEIALSFLLLTGAGLLLKSFVLLRTVNVGFNPDHLLTMSINPTGKYSGKTKTVQFYEELLQRVDTLAGVGSTGLVSVLPIEGHVMDTSFTIAGRPPLPPAQSHDALVRTAGPHYFRTMGIPLLKGRFFLPSDRLDQANKAIITESFARQYFPNENPIGQHMMFFGDTPREIVGIVGDVRNDIAETPEPTMYGPALGGDLSGLSLVVRAKGDPLAVALSIQKQIAKLDPDLAVSDVLTMDQLISKHTASQQLNFMLLSCFAGLAVLLAAIGLYAVLSYSTAQRTSEFGIRLALGATPGDLVRSVLKQGLVPAAAGLAIGFVGAYFLVRLIKSMLFDVQPFDPSVFLAAGFGLLLVSMLACLVPALRTTRIDPAQALRTE